jgi:putative RecB family exonuclease
VGIALPPGVARDVLVRQKKTDIRQASEGDSAPQQARATAADDGSRPVYSHSRLETFEQCKLKYKFRYLDKIEKKEQGVEAFVGSRVHEALEKLHADLASGPPVPLKELLNWYRAQWEANWGPHVRIVRRGTTAREYLHYGARCIRNYYEQNRPFDQSETLDLEQLFVFGLDAEGRYQIRGYADRIARRADGTYEIHDYKTSRRAPTQAGADSDRQLSFYQMGLAAQRPEATRVELVWHYLGPGVTLRSRRTPAQLVQLRTTTARLIDHIEQQREFPPQRSPLCDWCEYKPECPAWQPEWSLAV